MRRISSKLLPTCISLMGLLLIQPLLMTTAQAQYYPPPANGNNGYNPYNNTGGYNPYNTNNSGGYDPYAANGPPASGYTSNGVSPYTTGDAPSFGSAPYNNNGYTPYGGTPAATYPQQNSGYNNMAWSPAAQVGGFKFNYYPQAGDYFNHQSTTTGRWEQFPVRVHLTYPEQMSERDRKDVKAAIAAWQKYVDITLVERPDEAQIEFNWVSELSDEAELGETEYLETNIDSMGRTVIQKAVIRMLDPADYVDVYDGALESAVLHQMGHALGINTHSDNSRDLMAEPTYEKIKQQVVKKAVRSLAERTLGQLIDLPYAETDTRKRTVTLPVTKIGKRDLNTLYRMYH